MKTDPKIEGLKWRLSEAIGIRLAELGLNQSDAAESGVVSINRNDLSKILNHRFEGQSLQKILLLANSLGVEMDYEIKVQPMENYVL